MAIARLSSRIAIIAWLIFSLGLFYWGGLLLEAFGISIGLLWLCRLGVLVWAGSSIIFWQAFNTTKTSDIDSIPRPFIGITYTLIFVVSALFDSWLCLRGAPTFNPWVLVPLGHLALCLVLFGQFWGRLGSYFRA